MLLLLTILLVLISAVLLIVGFVQNHLSYIYLSMGCAALALLALVVFGRLSRRRAVRLATAGTGPAEATGGAAIATADEPARRRRGPTRSTARATRSEEETGVPATAAAPVGAEAVGDDAETARWDDWGDEVVFPIEGYDELRVAEIVPLLSGLAPEELEEVRDRELAGRNRVTILQRVDDLLGRAAAAGPAGKSSGADDSPAKAASTAKKAAAAKTGRARKATPAKARPTRTKPAAGGAGTAPDEGSSAPPGPASPDDATGELPVTQEKPAPKARKPAPQKPATREVDDMPEEEPG